MNFLTSIYNEIETENDSEVKKSQKAALYTLMNFIEASDFGSGIDHQEMEKRFFYKKEFSTIFQKLVDNDVVEKSAETGNYKLNSEAKKVITPLLEELMTLVYRPEKRVATSDPTLNLLYNCRSQLFSS